MSTFTIKIKLGNEAMQTNADIQKALKGVIRYLDYQSNGAIMDVNGNKVGKFGIK